MTLAIQSILIFVLLIVCCFTPGFFFIRRLRWTPLEKLCGSVGLSLVLIYLLTWAVFVTGKAGTRMPEIPLALISVTCVVFGVVAWRDVLRLIRSFRVKRMLLGYGFLLTWTLLLLGMIRVYSGAAWYGDWLEHFQRTLFFLWRLPANTSFSNLYTLPARPPLMNVLAAFFLGQTADRFELFQIVFTFLNLLMFLPCCLVLRSIGTPRTRILPLVMLFALNPMVMQNVTYSWTKALTAFFVVLGIVFYLAAWRKGDRPRMIAAFLSLAAALLVHYSAGPYVVFLTLHYLLWLFWKRTDRWTEVAAIFMVCTALLATWFAWSMETYGKATFLSNTAVTASQNYNGSNLEKVLGNTFDSIVPIGLRNPSVLGAFQQQSWPGVLRDNIFLFYQTNMIFGLGLVGGPVVLWLLVQRFRRKPRPHTSEWSFWLALVLFCVPAGFAVIGERDILGVAHVTLLTLEILGLTLLASALLRGRALAVVILTGCLLDFSVGIFLHEHVQSLENGPTKVFGDLEFSNLTIQPESPGPDTLSHFAWTNWLSKHRSSLYDRWLRELPERYGNDATFQGGWPGAQAQFLKYRSEDDTQWGGWYSRHNGEIEYFGDHIAGGLGEGVPAALTLALLTGLIAAMVKALSSGSAVQLTARSLQERRQGKRPRARHD